MKSKICLQSFLRSFLLPVLFTLSPACQIYVRNLSNVFSYFSNLCVRKLSKLVRFNSQSYFGFMGLFHIIISSDGLCVAKTYTFDFKILNHVYTYIYKINPLRKNTIQNTSPKLLKCFTERCLLYRGPHESVSSIEQTSL